MAGPWICKIWRLRQDVGVIARVQAARRRDVNGGERITATRRALRQVAVRRGPQVWRDVRRADIGAGRLLVFQRPLLNSAVKLTEIVNAGILLRCDACLDEVRNRDCGQKADDGHHNHDLDQREARPARTAEFHTLLPFLRTYGVNACNRRI